MTDPKTKKSLMPTRKWFANAVPVVAGWLVALIQNEWVVSTELQISAVGIVAGLLTSYLVSNVSEPGGVVRVRARRRG